MVVPRTSEVAGEIISRFRETGNLGRLLVDVSDFGRWFGRFGRYNRELFEKALVEEISKPPALTAQNREQCFMCTVQSKVGELGDDELQEISDLCLSELDRRESSQRFIMAGKVLKEEVRP